jgi:hypothetical protein
MTVLDSISATLNTNASDSAPSLKTGRKGTKMATNPQSINTVPTPETVTKKIKVFSAETLAPAESTYSYTFQDAVSLEEAQSRLSTLDQSIAAKRLLLAMNGVLNFFAAREARSSAVGNGIPRKALLKALGGFRTIEPFASMVTLAPKTPGYLEQKKIQTEAILEAVRNNPPLKTMIVSGITTTEDDGEDEDGDNE